MIREIAKYLNENNMNADLGYPGEEEGVFLLDTYSNSIADITKEESIQILVQVINAEEAYLKAKKKTEEIKKLLNKLENVYGLNDRYVGNKGSVHIFSINLKIGGIK
ncbi:MAG: hypothetical protein ACRC8F_03510 [Cetobacterium sp.]